MRKSFKWTKPSVSPIRIALALLLIANVVAAAFVFHIVGTSPEAMEQALTVALSQRQAEQARLNRSRTLNASIDTGKAEGDRFLASYMTSRRHTYSTIIGELTDTAKAAGIDKLGATTALDAVDGSEDLDMMSVTVTLEATYPQLMKLVNLLDRSPRFLILESLTATPRAKSDVLTINIKLDTFVREDKDGIS